VLLGHFDFESFFFRDWVGFFSLRGGEFFLLFLDGVGLW
jgi:hypothetical protein